MSIASITFIDIETVSILNPFEKNSFDNSRFTAPKFFEKKFAKDINDCVPGINTKPDWDVIRTYMDKAPLHAEFGKVVAISIGKFVPGKTHEDGKLYIRNLASRHEAELLTQASESIVKASGLLCAHNGMDFDFPFLMRRYMINGIPVPPPLNVAGVKPWDIKLEDTMKMWSGTQWNYKVSLDLLANIFGLPSPKKDMDGSDVARIYYDSFNIGENELPFEKEAAALKQIGNYCGSDVFCLANVYSKMKGLPIITEDQIIYV
jgi:predicted PolB exonuclease-like 3'-5' exonuclease